MKIFLRAFLAFFLIIFLVTIHIGITSFLSFPWNAINSILVVLVAVFIRRETGTVVWLSCLAHGFIELYSTTPFGIVLFSGTMSLLLVYWLYGYLFTNRSLLAATALTAAAVFFYRVMYIGGIAIFSTNIVPWNEYLSRSGMEIVLSVIAAAGLYGIVTLIAPQTDKSRYSIFTYER